MSYVMRRPERFSSFTRRGDGSPSHALIEDFENVTKSEINQVHGISRTMGLQICNRTLSSIMSWKPTHFTDWILTGLPRPFYLR